MRVLGYAMVAAPCVAVLLWGWWLIGLLPIIAIVSGSALLFVWVAIAAYLINR